MVQAKRSPPRRQNPGGPMLPPRVYVLKRRPVVDAEEFSSTIGNGPDHLTDDETRRFRGANTPRPGLPRRGCERKARYSSHPCPGNRQSTKRGGSSHKALHGLHASGITRAVRLTSATHTHNAVLAVPIRSAGNIHYPSSVPCASGRGRGERGGAGGGGGWRPRCDVSFSSRGVTLGASVSALYSHGRKSVPS